MKNFMNVKTSVKAICSLFAVTLMVAQPASARWHHGEVVVTPFPFPERGVVAERPYHRHHHAMWERVRVLDREISHLSREIERHPHAWRLREKREALILERERILARLGR